MMLHCQICAELFDALDSSRRFCSKRCTGRFRSRLPRGYRIPIRSQARVIAVLRARIGEWVSQQDLAITMYGAADPHDLQAVYVLLYRVRQRWSTEGLVIESRREQWRLEQAAETFYRLTQDLPSALAVAS